MIKQWKHQVPFKEYFVAVKNENFPPKTEVFPAIGKNNLIIGSKKSVVAYTDIEKIFEKYFAKWEDVDQPTSIGDMKMEIGHMMCSIQKFTFPLEYELPLNKRFVLQFKDIVESKGFVADSLPQDSVTIFGKSQPYLTIFRHKGEFIKGKSVMGVAISADQEAHWEVTGATLEFQKNVVHLKTRSSSLAQSCANMVHISGYLLERVFIGKGTAERDPGGRNNDFSPFSKPQ